MGVIVGVTDSVVLTGSFVESEIASFSAEESGLLQQIHTEAQAISKSVRDMSGIGLATLHEADIVPKMYAEKNERDKGYRSFLPIRKFRLFPCTFFIARRPFIHEHK